MALDLHMPPLLVKVTGVSKLYGETRALADAHLEVGIGDVVGVVGHNGAGKSTLMRVLGGTTRPDSGSIFVGDRDVTQGFSVDRARTLGIRSVYQELSLCPNLRVYENIRIVHGSLRGRQWKMRAAELIERRLADIFPGHQISAKAHVADLSIGQRQMVEIARAVTVTDIAVRLLILDEPTSSLDTEAAEQLFAFLKRERQKGLASLLISHRLGDILDHTDRVVVMRDGQVVANAPSNELSRERLVELMGGVSQGHTPASRERSAQAHAPICVKVTELDTASLHHVSIEAHSGEVIGLAGLAGHGQRELLLALFAGRRRKTGAVRVNNAVAYVSGDRQLEGIFQFWPVTRNISVGVLSSVLRRMLISGRDEHTLTQAWVTRLGIRGGADNLITNLSGGNQQKVLMARALASDAKVILLDDPTRGVDVDTKRQFYAMVDEVARAGRCVIWYTTETDELRECDRVYVFRSGHIVEEMHRGAISEDQVIAASFREVAGVRAP